MNWLRRQPKPVGAQGEDLAARALRREGYRILDRNVRLGRFEIDIVAQEGDTIAFVEVKTRRRTDVADPEDNVDAAKRRHLSAAAHRYMSLHPQPDLYYRYDVVAVACQDERNPAITIYRDAFRDEDV